MESCTEDDIVMTRNELQEWIRDKVEKSKLLEPSKLKISQLKSQLERREKQTAAISNLSGSLKECEASMKKLYTLLDWEYRDTDSEDEGQSCRTSICYMDENKEDGDFMDCDVASQSPPATSSNTVGPSFLMPDNVMEHPHIVSDVDNADVDDVDDADADAVKKTEAGGADIFRILRRRPVVVLTKLPEHQRLVAPHTPTPEQYSCPEEDLHINASSSHKPPKKKLNTDSEDMDISSSSSHKPTKEQNTDIERLDIKASSSHKTKKTQNTDSEDMDISSSRSHKTKKKQKTDIERLDIKASSSHKKKKKTIIEDLHIDVSSSHKPKNKDDQIIQEDPHVSASSSHNPRIKSQPNYKLEDLENSDNSGSDPNWDADGHESSGSDFCPEKKTKPQINFKKLEALLKNNNKRCLNASHEVATKQESAAVPLPIRVAAVTTISQAPTTRREEPPRVIKEESVKEQMKVLVKTESANWQNGQICKIIKDESGEMTYEVNCDETGICIVPGHHIAFHHPASVDQLYVGVRVVAIHQYENISRFHTGILAELPSRKNRMRFLVFFDNFNAGYMGLPNIRLVCRPLRDVCEDISDSGLKDFIKDYLDVWPHPPMVSYNLGEKINVDYEGVVKRCTVEEIDCSLMCVVSDKKKEWIYRGSIRLENMINMKKTMENVSKNGDKVSQPKADFNKAVHISKPQAASTTTSTSAKSSSDKATKTTNGKKGDGPPPTVVSYKPHDCSPRCLSRTMPKDDMESHRGRNPLTIPLLYEFRRLKKSPKNKSKLPGCVTYRSPCGLTLNTMGEVEEYLAQTACKFLFLDMFCMDPCVSVTTSYDAPPSKLYLPDLCQRKEMQPVSCFNEHNHIRPNQIVYIKGCVAADGIPVNSDLTVGCKCTDGCSKSKACACQQLSIKKSALGPRGRQDPKAGYKHKRLSDCIITGVYECNALCGCDPRMCSNRLVQHSVQLRLQIFMTFNKGWGVRCVDHVAKGTFVCSFSGRVERDDKKYAHYYCAELNYIEDAKHKSTTAEAEPKKSAQSEAGKFSDHKRKSRDANATTARNSDRKKCFYVIDASVEGNVARYLNHSCSPNLFVQNVYVDTHDPRLPWLSFFTKTHITPGTELTWDYRSVIGGIKGVSGLIDCRCGAENCLKKL